MAKRKKPLPYREGTWFAVPLRDGGYAVGVAARLDAKGIVFGYFFGPRHETVPTALEARGLSYAEAIYQSRFGDLGLIEGTWPILGESEEWNREKWPLPPFVRVDEHAGKAWKSVYAEDNLELVHDEPCDLALAQRCPEDGLAAAGFVEVRLTKLLGGQSSAAGSVRDV